MGRAPRVLEGWTPVQRVEYLFERGQVVGETITTESEWNEDQVGMMLALGDVEADICPGCGGFLSFTTKPDHGLEIDHEVCLHCDAIAGYHEGEDKNLEMLKGTSMAYRSSARRVGVKPVPLPPEAH